MGITRDGQIYTGEKCDSCSKFIHKALTPIYDYHASDSWLCVRCNTIPLEVYDRLMNDMPVNFRNQATQKQISDFRKLLKRLNKQVLVA